MKTSRQLNISPLLCYIGKSYIYYYVILYIFYIWLDFLKENQLIREGQKKYIHSFPQSGNCGNSGNQLKKSLKYNRLKKSKSGNQVTTVTTRVCLYGVVFTSFQTFVNKWTLALTFSFSRFFSTTGMCFHNIKIQQFMLKIWLFFWIYREIISINISKTLEQRLTGTD